MAYIKSSIEAEAATGGLSYKMSLGEHQSGDLLLADINNDGTAQGISLWNNQVTVSVAADTLTYTGNDYWTDGDQIYFSLSNPGGTSTETVYYIRDLNTGAKTFKIAATAGGAAIDLTSTGTTVHVCLLTAGANHPLNGWKFLYIPTRNSTGSMRKGIAWKIATSSNETSPTFYANDDNWNGITHVIRDVNSNPFGSITDGVDFTVTSTTETGNTIDSPTLTTATDGCLIIYSALMSAGSSTGKVISPSIVGLPGLHKYGGDSSIVAVSCYDQQESAGSTPTVTFYKSQAHSVVFVTLAIRNATGGALQPVTRISGSIVNWYGSLANLHDNAKTWAVPSTMLGATLNGIVVSSTLPSIVEGTVTIDYGGAISITHSESATVSESPAGSGIWVGAWHNITSTDFDGKIVNFSFLNNNSPTAVQSGPEGNLVVFGDGTNWAAFQIQNKSTSWQTIAAGVFIACGTGGATPYASSGTLNWSAITRVCYLTHRISSSTTNVIMAAKHMVLIDKIVITGGGESRPLNTYDLRNAAFWTYNNLADSQGTAQVLGKVPIQIGDGGTHTTYFDAEASSFEFPRNWSSLSSTAQHFWNAADNTVSFDVLAGANDTMKFTAGVMATDTKQPFSINASSSLSATYSFSGMSFVGWDPTLKSGITYRGATFADCDTVKAKAATLINCTIKDTMSANAALSFDADTPSVQGTEIDITSSTTDYHIELGTAVTAITLTDVTFTGSAAVNKVHVLRTTGTVTITLDGTTLVSGDVTSEGATVSIVSPTLERGLSFTNLQAGSFVKIFATGTDTELFSTLSSGTTETWDDATSGSITVDYVIQKVGYVPIRVTGTTVTGAVGTGIQGVSVEQKVDRAYVASSGLTINTNIFANTTTKKLGLTTASSLQNVYSYLIEQFIALGDSGEAFANVAFPIEPTGTNSFSFLNGWEWDLTTYSSSITNLSGDGLRYLDASRVTTAQWACIVAVGVPAGESVRLQQSDGGTTITATGTGEINELFQIYGDATHGNFDKRGYMVVKVQAEGYDQDEVDVVAQYGSLEDYSYTIALTPTANGVATGDPGITGVTITDHGASPVAWNPGAGLDKDYSITIRDEGSNSGTDIIKWLRYNFEQGGTFQSKDAFNWHDLVRVNGDGYRSVRGIIYGDTGATLKGVRVVTGADPSNTPHPDFNLFTADDGTTAAPPAAAVSRGIEFTGLASGSKVKVFNTGTDTERFSVTSSGTTETWEESTSGSVVVDYVIMKAGYLPIRVVGVTVTGSTSGVISAPVSQVTDRAYVASSGLTFDTNFFATVGTKKLGITTTSTIQNVYSYLIEQFIALGDEGEKFANVPFFMETNGPNSFTLLNGWEWDLTTYPNSITNLSRDGLRYLNTSSVLTAQWAALLSGGVPSGEQVRFQQSDGGTTIDADNTGDLDQLIQIYGDASHGNFDKRNYLVSKVQAEGYDQAEVDVVSQYGTLEDQLYVVSLAPTANTVPTGNPALASAPTITDHAGSPVTWNGIPVSITITDSAAGNTGSDIMQWLRYNFATGGTFQSKDGFDWHDLIQQNGSSFKTVRGKVYGDTGATLKGVRVVQNDGTTPHPDFTLFTGDDGTTYSPPPQATVTVGPFTTGSRVQLYDIDNSVELFNDVVTGTSKIYSETYTVDRTVRARISYISGTSAKAFIETFVGTITSSNPNISVITTQVDDAVYNANAIDGSGVTGVTFTDAAIDKVNINIPGGTVSWATIYAAFVYWISTAVGITDDIAYIDAVDTANYILTDMQIKNTSSPSVPLTVTGGYGRDSATGESVDLADTTGGTLIFAPDHVVAKIVSVGGVNVITGDIADVPTVTEISDRLERAGGMLEETRDKAALAAALSA